MLNRRQQWRRTRPRIVQRHCQPDELDFEIIKSLTPPKSFDFSRGQNRNLQGGVETNIESTSELIRSFSQPIRSLFSSSFQATFRSACKRKLTWNTTVHYRQIPSISGMSETDKGILWWSSADLQSFAQQELNRLLSDGNINASDAPGSLESGTPPTSSLLLPPAKSIEVAQPSLHPTEYDTIEAKIRATTPEDVPPLADAKDEPRETPAVGSVLRTRGNCQPLDEIIRQQSVNNGATCSNFVTNECCARPQQGTFSDMEIDYLKATNSAPKKMAHNRSSSNDMEGDSPIPGDIPTPVTPPTPEYIRKSNREVGNSHRTATSLLIR